MKFKLVMLAVIVAVLAAGEFILSDEAPAQQSNTSANPTSSMKNVEFGR